EDAALSEAPPESHRGVVDVVALDLEEEREADRVCLRAQLVAAEEGEGGSERFGDLGSAAYRPPHHAAIDVVRIALDTQVEKGLEALGEEPREDQRRQNARGAGALEVVLVAGGQREGEPSGDVDGGAIVDQVFGAEEHVADTGGGG